MENFYYILDEHGQPQRAESMAWALWFEATPIEGRTIAKTKIGEAEVSTVFLGLNHQWGKGPPLLFETLVFGGKLADEQERYSTPEEAKAGHEAMVRRVQMAEFGTLTN